jgi:hypothetical protein
MTLYLDLDGVLADFDRGFKDIFGVSPGAYEATHGTPKFWKDIAALDDFYGQLSKMPDADELFSAVAHMSPIILTGLPQGSWAEPQKRAWVAANFPGTPVITCLAKNKAFFRKPGDILVDDRLQYAHLWRANGGIFVNHTSASATLAQLKGLIDAKV